MANPLLGLIGPHDWNLGGLSSVLSGLFSPVRLIILLKEVLTSSGPDIIRLDKEHRGLVITLHWLATACVWTEPGI